MGVGGREEEGGRRGRGGGGKERGRRGEKGGEVSISAWGDSTALADLRLQGLEKSRKGAKGTASSIHIARKKIRYIILGAGLF